MLDILKKLLKIIIIPFIATFILVNYLLPTEDCKDAEVKITKALESGNNRIAKDEYEKLIKKDFFNIKYHRGFISSHLKQPEYIGKKRVRNDDAIIDKYMKYSQSNDIKIRDAGFYGLGYFYSSTDEPEDALENFLKVKQKTMPFLNNSIGIVYLDLEKYELAESYFNKEIAANGYVEGAYYNLAELFCSTKDYDKLERLVNNPGISKYLSSHAIRLIEIRNFRIGDYLRSMISIINYNIFSFTGAFLILLCWFLYLKNLDIFEPEPVRYALTALIMGMLASTFAVPLYDIADFFLGFTLNGHYLNDMIFCIFGIGVIEESLKIVPVILMLKYTKVINESIDYIIYGSFSALGFAFIENLMYFHDGGLIDFTSRAFSSVILHMALTSIVIYGVFYSKYKAKDKPRYYFCISYCCAAAIHGIYDFFLISNGFISYLSIVSMVILLYCIVSYSKAINCALNFSEFMTKTTNRNIDQTNILCGGLSAIILLQYIFISYKFGAENANLNLLWTAFTSYYIVCLIILIMGNIKVNKFRWVPIFEYERNLDFWK